MKFLAGKEYSHLCEGCQAVIDTCSEVVLEGPDTDNIEAPFDFAADNLLLCGGSTCRGGFKVGQICHWGGMYYSAIVLLEEFDQRGGFWLARNSDWERVCPITDDLQVITDQSPLHLRHAARMMERMGDLRGRGEAQLAV